MNLSRLNILILGVCLVIIGVVLHLLHYMLSDFILGIGLLITLSAAFLFTYNTEHNDVNEEE
ncbi:hypothetical protein [Robertkochia flava]|uniref:hypothetical protein n=1 Tax=Robertkochia flava TaxID=3447986 RepID=UPI001CCCA151|nr:hypothetical protein [Robertkochia marina]